MLYNEIKNEEGVNAMTNENYISYLVGTANGYPSKTQRYLKMLFSTAGIDVGKNENYILPIIGELKEILNDHRNDLDKCPALKESLEQFMFENDELSECTWIEIMWENEIKVRSIRVKFIFNYKNRMYCLLQHYYSNVLVGMERMNHVVRYISKHKDDAQ